MDERLRRVLILDSDPDCLTRLQRVLEDAGIDTTITCDKTEACQRLESQRFDLIVIGDHPPEVDSAAILDDLSLRGTCPPVLILQSVVRENDIQYFGWRGAIGVVSKGNPLTVRDQVAKALSSLRLRSRASEAGSLENRSWRVAS
ncbi:MAG TPA: response regulator [Candidatus Sulfotelmatobacter sp.]|nr:response regulator [Candidatus Sulfotelmatobacter sp.]